MIEFRKYDTRHGANLREPISAGDLPNGWALVGQFSKPIVVTIAAAGATTIGHDSVEIQPDSARATFVLNPFSFKPKVAGYYYVHHQRFDRIFDGSSGNYLCSIAVNTSACSGASGDVREFGVPAAGSVYDICKMNYSAIVYCDGDTDAIEIILSHDHTSARTFGAPTGLTCITHTSIFYIGPKKPTELEVDFESVSTFGAVLSLDSDVTMSAKFDSESSIVTHLSVSEDTPPPP